MKAYQARNRRSVPTLCRVFEVSASGYYAWCTRAPSARQQADVLLGDRLESYHQQSHCTYGRVRLQGDLRDEGIRVSDKRVARLMRERKLVGASRRKGYKTTIRDRDARPAPDLVDRRFTATAPDQLWVADISVLQQHRRSFVMSR